MALINLNDNQELPIWSKLEINSTNYYCWKFETKEVYLKRTNTNWFFAELETGEPTQPSISANKIVDSTLLKWSTFIGNGNNTMQALPTFPNRPLVLKPSTPLKVLPQNELLLFVEVPCSVRYYAGAINEENLVYETTTERLSSTWFGEPDNGVLSYSLPFETTKVLNKPSKHNRYHVICPIKLFNDSNVSLDVQRLLLRCEFLNIYWNKTELFANEVRIKFKGENVLSDVDYLNNVPPYIKNAELLTEAHSAKSNNVISKSFHFIKSLASS